MNSLMTEREWRKQYFKRQKRPDWWGPQYVIKSRRRHPLCRDRAFRLFLLLLSVTFSALLPGIVPRQQPVLEAEPVAVDLRETFLPRQVSAVRYEPYIGPTETQICTMTELSEGKLLVLDTDHPYPGALPPPNTFSIASYGHGMVPVSSLSVQSGRETIGALQQLFRALREKGIHDLQVCGGTVSSAQQRKQLMMKLRSSMKTSAPDQSVAQTVSQNEWPGTGEMLGEHTVEISFRSNEFGSAVDRTAAEQILFQTAWRYGFICTRKKAAAGGPYRFRYVGMAHATAMTYLDLELETYLHFLHQKGSLTIWEHGAPKYLIICKPMTGTRVQFELPVCTQWEASLDNLGYAVAACTL